MLIGMFAVIFVSAMTESCILSITYSDIFKLQKNFPRIGTIWKRLKQDINRSFTLVLIFNTVAIILCASIGGAYLSLRCAKQWFIPMAVILSYIVIQWGIVLPRTLGIRFKIPMAFIIAVPLYVLTIICRPLVLIVGLVNKPFESGRTDKKISPLLRLQHLRNLLHWIMRSAVNRRILSKEAFSFPE